MYRSVAKKFIMAAVVVLAGILVYSLIGIYVNTSNIRIYDEFPEEFFCYPPNPEEELSCNIRNNAPMTPPFINPFYGVSIKIVDSENDAFVYFIGIGNKKRNFTDWSLDLGRIDAGDSKKFNFFLHPDEGNVTFRIKVYLSFVFKFEAASATYFVEYHGDHRYTISKTK